MSEISFRGLRGRSLLAAMLHNQRECIEACEQGVSYDGPNGAAIRAADLAVLKKLERGEWPYPLNDAALEAAGGNNVR
mgnify:CR=1 FL=1